MDECILRKFNEILKGSGYSDRQMHRVEVVKASLDLTGKYPITNCDGGLLRVVEKVHDGK